MWHVHLSGEKHIKKVIQGLGYKTLSKFVNEAVWFYLGYKFKINKNNEVKK